MIILSLETSGRMGGVAITGEQGLVAEWRLSLGMRHSEALMRVIDNLLRETKIALSEVGAFAVSAGPGSFTGLRVGLATAKGLALPDKKPLLLVPTLEAIAASAGSGAHGLVIPLMPAGRGTVYWSLFDRQGRGRLLPDAVATLPEVIASVSEYGQDVLLVGEGATDPSLPRHLLSHPSYRLAPPLLNTPSPASVAECGRARLQRGEITTAEEAAPIYVKDFNARPFVRASP